MDKTNTSALRNAVAIIPARGGSKGIPRKNARLLGRKPLLAYSIEAAKAARCFTHIYVSTDDGELSEIAHRFGTEVIERSPENADDKSTLDDVIVEACKRLEERIAPDEMQYVATIQPTSPLLLPDTIRKVVTDCIQKELDTVLTVVNEPHLAWTRRDGHTFPLYEARVNRQSMPPYMRETGGIVVCPKSQLMSGTRFGAAVSVVELSKEESIDIDDYFDWWLAEKALNRKHILFHIAGNREIGLGHVYRALTLAYRLPEHTLSFLVNDHSGIAGELLQSKHFPVEQVAPGDETKHIVQVKPDLVVNDILDTPEPMMIEMREHGIPSINFEDRGPGSSFADIVVNAMYDEDPRHQIRNAFHGVKYCCLRDEFYSVQARQANEHPKNVLLLFGGTDPSNLTQKCLQWIDSIEGAWDITVVICPRYPGVEELEGLVGKCTHNVNLVRDTAVISKYMAKADIAITSAGRTVFELAALEIPMIVIAQNEREQHHVFAKSTPGAIYLGHAADLDANAVVINARELLASRILREKMKQSLRNADIRGGIERVLFCIESLLSTDCTPEA